MASTTTLEMESGGDYTRNTYGAKLVIDKCLELILPHIPRAAKSGDAQGDRSFRIVDFGAADGGTSLSLMQAVVEAVRAISSRPIEIVYEDRPTNDWTALFQMTSSLANMPHVHISAVGIPFHEQVVRDGSVDIAFSATAMHWLKECPAPIADHVHHAAAPTSPETQSFASRAAVEWEEIMSSRARELKSGGLLVVANFTISEENHFLGNTTYGRSMFSSFAMHWRKLWDSGRITEEEFRTATFPQYYRSNQEALRPFTSPDGKLANLFNVISCDCATVKCPYRTDYEEHGDPTRFAREFIATTKSWSKNVFKAALHCGRSEEEKNQIVDNLYDAYMRDVEAEPGLHGMDYVHLYIVLKRTDVPYTVDCERAEVSDRVGCEEDSETRRPSSTVYLSENDEEGANDRSRIVKLVAVTLVKNGPTSVMDLASNFSASINLKRVCYDAVNVMRGAGIVESRDDRLHWVGVLRPLLDQDPRNSTSLRFLAARFIEMAAREMANPRAEIEGIDLKALAREIDVPQRRIYDVTSILSALGLVERLGKNSMCMKPVGTEVAVLCEDMSK